MNAAVAEVLNAGAAIARATVEITRTRVAGRDIWSFVGFPAAVDEAVRKKRDELYSSVIESRTELDGGKVKVTVKDWGCD